MNTKITEGAIFRIVEADINTLKDGREKYTKEYAEYQKGVEKLQKKYSKNKGGGGLLDKVATKINPNANLGVKYQTELNQLQSKYGEAIAANYLLQRKSDKELEEFNNKLKQGISYQGTAIANQSKILRYTKETNNAASGGKTTTKATVKTEYQEGSVGYLEDLISDLQKKIKVQVDATEIEKLQKQIKQAKDQLEMLLNPQKLELKELRPIDVSANIKLDTTIDTKPIVKDLFEVYREAQDRIDLVLDAYDMGMIGSTKAKEFIAEVNKTLTANKLKPIEIDLITDDQKALMSVQSKAASIVSAFDGIDSIINNIDSLSDAINNGANAWDIFIGTLQTSMSVINGVSEVINTLNSLTDLFGIAQTASATKTTAAATAEAAAVEATAAAETAAIPSKTASATANKGLETTALDAAAANIFLAHSSIPFAGVGLATRTDNGNDGSNGGTDGSIQGNHSLCQWWRCRGQQLRTVTAF